METADAAPHVVERAQASPQQVVECIAEIVVAEAASDVGQRPRRSDRRDPGSDGHVGVEELSRAVAIDPIDRDPAVKSGDDFDRTWLLDPPHRAEECSGAV